MPRQDIVEKMMRRLRPDYVLPLFASVKPEPLPSGHAINGRPIRPDDEYHLPGDLAPESYADAIGHRPKCPCASCRR